MFNKRTVDHHCKTDPHTYHHVSMSHLWLSFRTFRYTGENVLVIYLKFCPFGFIKLNQ